LVLPLSGHRIDGGATIDFLLSALRDAAAAKRLFRQALSDPSHPHPRIINTDQARLYGAAMAAVKAEGTLRRRCLSLPKTLSG
jgi:transposase-like protein